MLCLAAAAAFTGMTYFVENFWQLVLVRMAASSFAQAEFVVSITLVNEEIPARHRGLFYAIVQAGWPMGLFLASGVYLLFGDEGWRFVFLLGVIPMAMVIVGRAFIKESDRFQHLQEVKAALRLGNSKRVQALLKKYNVDVSELQSATVRQLLSEAGGVRRQLLLLSAVYMSFGASIVATNFCITDYLTRVKGLSASETSTLLLVSAGSASSSMCLVDGSASAGDGSR